MRFLFWLYVIFYVAISVWGVTESLTDHDPVSLIVIDVLSVILTSAGMMLYYFRRDLRRIARPWKVVLAFLFIDFVFSTLRAITEEGSSDPGDAVLMLVVTAIVILIELPKFIINGKVAMGRGAPWRRPAAVPADDAHR